ncbi:hypothetical protein, partial [Methylicorpusculum sp.]|uniref:hypothetical protein n=1 Tax=Methylicorpusculum sp. TaxID=2713644 RepID=UPI002ABB497F
TIKTATNSFEECPECVPPAEGSIGILPPKGTTEEVVNEEEQVVNNLTNECAKEIFSNLREENFQEDFLKPEILLPSDKIFLTFSQSILKLFNELEFIKYTVQNGTLDGLAGQTGPFERGILTTISDSYLQNATKLSIARTMIHESVHAYILYKNSSLDFDFRQSIELFGKENGYDIKVDPNRFHHEFMGQYINAMAYSLLQWDKKFGSGGNLGWEYYHAMAFGGLFFKDSSGNLIETDSFKELVPNSLDRKKIINILKNEEQGNSSSKGIKC